MTLQQLSKEYLSALEADLQRVVAINDTPQLTELHTMMRYHLGWEGENAGLTATGKRIRPLLVLLTTAASGGDWKRALPAATAIELVHNYSLIHDDIEDNSDIRRGRPTVWKRWGIAQAINTGDAMFTLAHLALLGLRGKTSAAIALEAAAIFQETCLQLTQGQHLDIAYEERIDLTLNDYWPMIEGKTAALLAACTELGALIAETPGQIRQAYRDFGLFLGLAFQALDDLLGIWGDSNRTGKSTASDLVEGKKTLPVLYGLATSPKFAKRWAAGSILPAEAPEIADMLESAGARAYAQKEASRLTDKALNALEHASPQGDAGEALVKLAQKLLKRKA